MSENLIKKDWHKIAHDLLTENNKLRAYIADSTLDCIYCGLPADEMSRCASGFPGCGRADDMTMPEFDGDDFPDSSDDSFVYFDFDEEPK